MKPLSDSMRRMLFAVIKYKDPHHGISGQAAHGGADGTIRALQRRKLIEYLAGWRVTPEGKRVARVIRRELAKLRDAVKRGAS